jgi:integrase
VIRWHDLRGSHATLALQAGVHPKVVSDRLGHASVAFTLGRLLGLDPAMQADAADTVAALIFGTEVSR